MSEEGVKVAAKVTMTLKKFEGPITPESEPYEIIETEYPLTPDDIKQIVKGAENGND